MAVRYQLVINCVGHPERLARFWAQALGYVLEPPPACHVAQRPERGTRGGR